MEEINHHISQLKNLVSLRYVDPAARAKCLEMLTAHQPGQLCTPSTEAQKEQCRSYVLKVEQLHDRMMSEVSQFINLITPLINDYSHQIQTLTQQALENTKMHQLQLRDLNNQMIEMNDKIIMLTNELQEKEEFVRELGARVEEKQLVMEQRQREEQEYLRKIETDFNKQQKALQESIQIIQCKEEEIMHLREQLALVHEQATYSEDKPDSVLRSHQTYKNSPTSPNNQDDSFSVVQCSLISSSNHSHEGLSQFQEIRGEQEPRGELWEVNKGETIKEMLAFSLEKEYQLHYNKFEGIGLASKENCRHEWNRDEKGRSDEKKAVWGVGQSIQLVTMTSKPGQIQEFKSSGDPSKRPDNPYYIFFLIASQNVKIRSPHFQRIGHISTDPEWSRLNTLRIPLHMWQSQLDSYLQRQVGI